MQIWIHDNKMKKIVALNNDIPDMLSYTNSSWHSYLDQATSTFDFTIPKFSNGELHEDLKLINDECFVSFYVNGSYQVFYIATLQEDDFNIQLTCNNTNLEYALEYANPFSSESAQTIEWYLNHMDLLSFAAVEIGNNEISDRKRTLTFDSQETKMNRLQSLMSKFEAEFEFKVELNRDGTYKRIVINIYQEADDTHHGIGTDRKDVVLYYSNGLKGVQVTSDKTQMFNAGVFDGKDGVNLANVEFSEKNADGVEEFYSRKGDIFVYAPLSMQRYPATMKPGGQDNWIRKDFTTEYENVNDLKAYALRTLKKYAYPLVTYTASVQSGFVSHYTDLKLGDTIRIIDKNFVGGLALEARVSEMIISFDNPANNSFVFTNYRKLDNKPSSALQTRIEQAVESKLPYRIELATTGGVTFKNNEGETIVKPSLYKGNLPYTTDVTWRWALDGVVTVGMQYLARAENIDGTAVLTVSAYVGNNEVATTEITLTDVNDGDDGVGVESIDRYFTSSDQSDGVTIEGAEWSDKPPAPTEDGKYLWAYDEITYTDGTVTTTKPAAVGANFDVDAFRAEIAEDLKDVPNREEFENKIAEELANSKAEIETQIETAKTQAESNAKEYADTINQETAKVAELANAAADEIKADLVNVKNNLTDTSLVANNAQAAVDAAKQDLANVASELNTAKQDLADSVAEVNTKVDNAKEELTQAKQDLANVASELNTAKQDLTDSVTAVNNKVDNAKEELTQAKQDLANVADDLNTAKQDFQNAVSAVDTKATNLKSDLAQAKQDLASQAQQLQEQAGAQSELTNRVSSVEETANGTKTTVSELSKTVAQNGKDITSVTARTKVVEDDLAGTKTTLSQVKTTADSTSQKTATLETGLNGLNARFENLKIGSRNYFKDSKSRKYYIDDKETQDVRTFIDDDFWQNDTRFTKDYVRMSFDIAFNPALPSNFTTNVHFSASPWYNCGGITFKGGTTDLQHFDLKFNLSGASKSYKTDNVFIRLNNTLPLNTAVSLENFNLYLSAVVEDYSPNDADLEQKVAEYKQNADQNYASLQTTVQNLDGTVQHNKTVAEQTAQGFKTRIESLETYKNGESERANAYFESAKTETAKQLTAERTAIAKDYVAKSTYTSDVTGIRNELSATTSTANTTKTNLANYQASNDRAVANLQSNLQTANGNISSLKTKVEAVPGQITSAVSSVEGKIPKSVGGRNLALGTSGDWSGDWTNFNGQNNQTRTIYRIYNRGFKIGDKVNVRLVLKYSDIVAAEGQRAEVTTQFKGNVTEWGEGQLAGGRFWVDKSDGEIELKGEKVVDEYILKNEFWEWRLRVDYVKSGKIQWKEAKAEVGDLPTPWSPAPEDTVEQITNLSSEIKQTADGMTLLATKTELSTAKNELQSGISTATDKANAAQNTANSAQSTANSAQNKANSNAQIISTHTTQISALNTGLSAKVSQSDFNTLSGRVTTAENNITAKANELSSKISSVEGKIPTNVGARNYIRNYGLTATGWGSNKAGWKIEIIPDSTAKSGQYLKATCTTASTSGGGFYKNLFDFSDGRFFGKQMTWAMDIKLSKGKSVKIGPEWGRAYLNFNATTEWKRYSKTFTVATTSEFKQWIVYTNDNVWNVGDIVYIRDVQLEDGSIATSPVPAIEDTESDITKLSSELTQTKDGITLLATKTELSTAKNELQSGINTATNKANAAQNTANSAQSTANSAQNKANSNAQIISTHTTQISALNTGLQAKVSQTDFNTLSGRVTTAENNITAKANELSSKITSVEGKLPSGEMNLVEYGRPANGYSPYACAEYTTHPFYYNGALKMYIIKNSTTSEKIFGMNRFKVERNTDYTLYFKGFNNSAIANMDVLFLKRVSGSKNDWDSAQTLVDKRKLSISKAEDISVTFNTGNYDEGFLRFDNNGTTSAGTEAALFFGDVSVKKGKSNSGWSPSLAELASSQDLKTAQSEIKQTKDGMTLLATKTELNSAKTDLQSGINTATNKADAAQNTANSAQSTANSAQNKANSNAQIISTHTTQISALNTGLQAKVSQTDFNTLSGRVTTAENNITAKANELSSKITSVEGKIPTSVSQRNLVQGTSVAWSPFVNITKNNNWTYSLATVNYGDKTGIYAGTTINLFVYLSADEIVLDSSINPRFSIQGEIIDKNGSVTWENWDKYHPFYNKWSTNLASGNNYRIVKFSAKVSSESYSNINGFKIAVRIDGARSGKFHHRALMVTTGDVFPDSWSAAPEDTIEEISSLSSELKQTKDGMTLLATKTEVNSAKTDLQSGITTATNKANAAQSTADSAVTKANAAQSTANSNAQTISTHTTQISALNTGLSAKVSQTDFNTLSGRVTTAENNIIAKANELSSKISSVEGAIEDTQSDITKLSSEIKQTADGMTMLATKTELNSAKTDLQSGITTATNKANAAQSTADSAVTKANSAQSKANSNAQIISTHTTQISALNTGLSAKVSQTDFNTLSGRVTTAENNITAKANELSSKISSVEGKIPSGEMNLVEYGRPADGYSPYAGAEYATHGFYYNGAFKMYIIRNKTTSEKLLSMNRFKVERNTEYTLYFKGFNNSSITNMDVWFLKRVNGSKNDYDSAQQLVSNRKLSNSRAEDISVTFNTGEYDEGYLRFDNNGIATAGTRADLYFGDVSVKKGKSNSGWSPSLAELASSQDLKNAQSEIKQTTDAITASVSSVQTAASNAQSTANTAVSKADAAQAGVNTLDSTTVKSASLTINTDGIVMKAGKSTTDVANAIGSYFAVNQNAINLFSDKINVKGNMIVSGAITSDKIASKSINTSHLNGKIITADVIATNAITADAIKAGAVTTDKMSANSINGDRIAAGTLDAAKIKAGSITSSQIASGTITSNQIKAGGISSANIAAGAITTDKIAAGAIDASKIAANAISANMITGGKLNSTNGATVFDLNAGTLTFNNNYGYIQRSASDKVFEITTYLGTSSGSQEYLTSAFNIRKSDNSRQSGVKFTLYNTVENKPTAEAKINADALILYDSQNTRLFSVHGKSTFAGGVNFQGWGDIPIAKVHGGLVVQDIGIGSHTKSLLKIVEELCKKAGILWV